MVIFKIDGMMEDQAHGNDIELIDVDRIFKNKNPRLYNVLPGFILRYIKRIIHQDELNEALVRFKDDKGVDFVRSILDYMNIEYTVTGEENIPGEGRLIFVSNHPLGGLDGLIFIDIIGKRFSNIRFIVNDILLNIKNLESIFVPVNKYGRQSAAYARKIEDVYRSDNQVLYFPAGLCSRKSGKRIMDLEWKKNFIKKAVDHKRDVIPMYFSGSNSGFFYRLANLRKFLGIKANIELFLLSDEMFRQKGRKISVKIGKPVPYTTFDSSKNQSEWAKYLKDLVYEMGKEVESA